MNRKDWMILTTGVALVLPGWSYLLRFEFGNAVLHFFSVIIGVLFLIGFALRKGL